MSRAKTIDPPRPSIFDGLTEKYPELAEADPVKPPRPRVPGLWTGFALVALLGASALGIYVRAGDWPPASRELLGISLSERTEPEEEPSRAAAKPQLPSPPPAPLVDTAESPIGMTAIKTVPEGPELRLTDSEPRPTPLAPSQPAKKPAPSFPKEAPAFLGEEAAALCDADALHDPVKLHGPRPEYPETARRAFQEGTVIIEAEVDDAGAVENVRTLRGATPELDRAALAAVATWRFEPATCAGQPVAGRYRTALHFDLRPPQQDETTADATTSAALEPPVKLFAPPPTYPPAEWVAAIEGDVTLKATIDEAGLVVAVEVLKGVSPGLDEAAVQTLERWRFRPARRGDELARFEQVLTFRFRR